MALPLTRLVIVLACFFALGPSLRGTTVVSAAPRAAFVPVLIYHHVKWPRPGDNAIERGLTISPAQLATELTHLAVGGYRSVTARDIAAFLRGGPALPKRPVALTFDDGYSDVYANAYQVLLRRRMRATFFIVPGFLDKPRYLTWKQVENMAAHGMDIEAHSMTHPDLTTVPAAQMQREIRLSRLLLESRLHRQVRVFAYPYGAYNGGILRSVRSAGYYAAFTTHQGWWQTETNRLVLPRVYVDNDDTASIFAGRLVADAVALAADPT
jgi:peptidoglycan/xylan/chitin deacetylase (PgdA/CDA1 family)